MKNLQFKDMIRRYGILIGLIGLITGFSVLSERFFAISNMLIVMRQTSIVAFLAVGMSFVILGAGIDLTHFGVVMVLNLMINILQGQPRD